MFSKLDREHPHWQPGIVEMMRQMVVAMGIEQTLSMCKFPPVIDGDMRELNRLCLEYLFFEEGKPDEPALRAECERTQQAIAG